jgi:hypothetical protein
VKKELMKSLMKGALVCLVSTITAGMAFAEDRVVVIWECDINDGKTLEDVKSDNGKWVRYVNKAAGGGDIRSFVTTTIIGNNTADFMYLDSYPNLEAWTATQKALEEGEGVAIEQALEADASCTSSSLLNAEESG